MSRFAARRRREPSSAPVHPRPSASGHALAPAQRRYFENKLAHDFSRVRIHHDANAAHEAGARAYTLGQDIVLGGSATEHSLAHELTHVAQQKRDDGTSSVERAEQEASTSANALMQGRSVSLQSGAPSSAPMLQEEDATQLRPPDVGSALRRPPMFGTASQSFTIAPFDTNSASLLAADLQARVDRLAQMINTPPLTEDDHVIIWGGADMRGTAEHNRTLGQQRADAVLEALAGLGIPRTQMRSHSSGEPEEGTSGDVPGYRQVTVIVLRRTVDLHLRGELSANGPRAAAPPPLVPIQPFQPFQPILPPRGTSPIFPYPQPLTLGVPQPRAPSPDFIHMLSVAITGSLHRRDIARLAAGIASNFGFDEGEVTNQLDGAFVAAGEAGLRELLRTLINLAVPHLPGYSPDDPSRDPLPREVDYHEWILRSPVIRF